MSDQIANVKDLLLKSQSALNNDERMASEKYLGQLSEQNMVSTHIGLSLVWLDINSDESLFFSLNKKMIILV